MTIEKTAAGYVFSMKQVGSLPPGQGSFFWGGGESIQGVYKEEGGGRCSERMNSSCTSWATLAGVGCVVTPCCSMKG